MSMNKEEFDSFILNNFKDYLGLVVIGCYDTIKEISKMYGKEDEYITEINGVKLDYSHFTTDVSGHRVTFIYHNSFTEKDEKNLYVFPLKDRENAGLYYYAT